MPWALNISVNYIVELNSIELIRPIFTLKSFLAWIEKHSAIIINSYGLLFFDWLCQLSSSNLMGSSGETHFLVQLSFTQ